MGKTVVVTGSSSGFGREVSEKLARRGDRVYATMRGAYGSNSEVAGELRALADSEGLDLRVLDLDVTAGSSVEAAASQALEESGAPDVVINNAGQMFVGLTETFSAEELARQLDVNVVGVHRVSRAFLPAMRERGSGLLINVSSIAGRMAAPFFGVYHASKWALEGYSLAMRRELASCGVDVVVVEPGPFTTQLFPRSPQPADVDGRAARYPSVAHETFEALGAAFDEVLEDPEMPTDPTLVVDRMVELADMDKGTRPFRSVVGVDFGVRDRNASDEAHDPGLLEAMGLTEFATLHRESEA